MFALPQLASALLCVMRQIAVLVQLFVITYGLRLLVASANSNEAVVRTRCNTSWYRSTREAAKLLGEFGQVTVKSTVTVRRVTNKFCLVKCGQLQNRFSFRLSVYRTTRDPAYQTRRRHGAGGGARGCVVNCQRFPLATRAREQ